MFFLHDIASRPNRGRTATISPLDNYGYVNSFWSAIARAESYSAVLMADEFGVEDVDLRREGRDPSWGFDREEYPDRLINPLF